MKIYITRKIPDVAFELLEKEGFEIIYNEKEEGASKDEIVKGASGCDGLITLLSDKIDKSLLKKLDSIKIISNYAVGYNNIDLDYCRQKNIIVCNTPDVLTHAVADLGFALLMAVARRIPESDRFVREGKFKGWEPKLLRGRDVYGMSLGVIGAGRIGSQVLKRGTGFDMRLLYNATSPKESLEKDLRARFVTKEEIAGESDFIVLCTPLTGQTYHIVDKEFISNMKKDAILINIARGPVVDEKELIRALKENRIAGAGFDVYENEPEVPDELKELDNVVLLPHTGSSTFKSRDDMALLCARSIVNYLKYGNIPENRV